MPDSQPAPRARSLSPTRSLLNFRHPFTQPRRAVHSHGPGYHGGRHGGAAVDAEAPPPAGAATVASTLAVDAAAAAAVDPSSSLAPDDDEHEHYSHRSPWLRAGVLGANDGLVSTASLMLGVGGGSDSLRTLVLAGVAGLVAGALSMAVGEYISMSSQRDAEEADIAKEAAEQAKGPAARARELGELAAIYEARGISPGLARAVAEELSAQDVVRAHARDELGIDVDALANPLQAAAASALSFTIGAVIPLLAAAFIQPVGPRFASLITASCVALFSFGVTGAVLGGAPWWRGGLRVLLGGSAAMALTYGIGRAFNVSAA
jgi:vacuolar iron transporter family protein